MHYQIHQVWLLVLSLHNLARVRQTDHLMHEAECMNEGCLTSERGEGYNIASLLFPIPFYMR